MAAFVWAGCAVLGGARKAPPVVGTWSYSMSSPAQGVFSGMLTFTQDEDDAYSAHLTVQEMGIDEAVVVESFQTEGPAFTLKGAAAGYNFTINGMVDGDAMTGENDVQGVGLFQLSGTRVVVE